MSKAAILGEGHAGTKKGPTIDRDKGGLVHRGGLGGGWQEKNAPGTFLSQKAAALKEFPAATFSEKKGRALSTTSGGENDASAGEPLSRLRL